MGKIIVGVRRLDKEWFQAVLPGFEELAEKGYVVRVGAKSLAFAPPDEPRYNKYRKPGRRG